MKLSAQEEFGLRCMLWMAREHPFGAMKIGEIAKHESLTIDHVAKLMRVLRIAGLIYSIRGQNGGYRLAREPEDIDLAEIFAALGGRFFGGDSCRRYRGKRNRCAHTRDCPIRPVLSGVDRLIQGFLSRCRLSDLLANEASLNQWADKCLSDRSLYAILSRSEP
jgi:Rrf2 family protein